MATIGVRRFTRVILSAVGRNPLSPRIGYLFAWRHEVVEEINILTMRCKKLSMPGISILTPLAITKRALLLACWAMVSFCCEAGHLSEKDGVPCRTLLSDKRCCNT